MCGRHQGMKECHKRNYGTVLKPVITLMSSDGIVTINIKDKEYEYRIDTGHYQYIKDVFNFRPWQGVNFLKTNCKWGGKGVCSDGN